MIDSKPLLFVNWTNETFSGKPYKNKKGDWQTDEHCKWNGQPYTFKPGEKMYLEGGVANHFAKHLAKREIAKVKGGDAHMSPVQDTEGKFLDPLFQEYVDKALIREETPESELPVETQLLNKNKALETKEKKAPAKSPDEEFAN